MENAHEDCVDPLMVGGLVGRLFAVERVRAPGRVTWVLGERAFAADDCFTEWFFDDGFWVVDG